MESPAAPVLDLIDRHPLAWIVPYGDPSVATPMPMLLDRDAKGEPISLTGHLPSNVPVVRALRRNSRVTCIFAGPHRYIDPAWLARDDWAPTWNFVGACVSGSAAFDPASAAAAIERLVAHMEGGDGWNVAALGERYQSLLRRVTGFTVRIDSIDGHLKLGQDERGDDFTAIVDALGDDPLAVWMRRIGRGGDAPGRRPIWRIGDVSDRLDQAAIALKETGAYLSRGDANT